MSLVICTLRVRQPNRLAEVLEDIRNDPKVRLANHTVGTRDEIVVTLLEEDRGPWVEEALEAYDLLMGPDEQVDEDKAEGV